MNPWYWAPIGLAAIPAAAACCRLCSIYEPHQCGGWRVKDLVRQVPGRKIFGRQLPPTQVPVCQACHSVEIRKS